MQLRRPSHRVIAITSAVVATSLPTVTVHADDPSGAPATTAPATTAPADPGESTAPEPGVSEPVVAVGVPPVPPVSSVSEPVVAVVAAGVPPVPQVPQVSSVRATTSVEVRATGHSGADQRPRADVWSSGPAAAATLEAARRLIDRCF